MQNERVVLYSHQSGTGQAEAEAGRCGGRNRDRCHGTLTAALAARLAQRVGWHTLLPPYGPAGLLPVSRSLDATAANTQVTVNLQAAVRLARPVQQPLLSLFA